MAEPSNFQTDINFHTNDWLDNIFDIIYYDDEKQFDEKTENILQEYNEDFDFHVQQTNLDEEVMVIEPNAHNKTAHDQVLSQKLSQLSTQDEGNTSNNNNNNSNTHLKRSLSTSSTPDVVWKKICIWDDQINKDSDISEYCERLNNVFDQCITNYLKTNEITTIAIDELRDLAVLKHKIRSTHLRQQLWTVYYKSSIGQYETDECQNTTVNRCVWPKSIKSQISTKFNSSDVNNKAEIEEKLCAELIQNRLQELQENLEKYQLEYNEKKHSIQDFTDQIETLIETFVEQYSLLPFQKKFNYKLALFECEYVDRILIREYFQLKPNDYQIQMATRLYDLKYIYVKTKYELIELKQRILCNKPTNFIYSKASFLLTTPSSEADSDAQIFQRQIDREDKELQSKMTDLMVEAIAEVEQKIYHNRELLNKEIRAISTSTSTSNTNGVLTEKLVHLIYRRFNIINRKLDYMCKFRIDYFFQNEYDELLDIVPLKKIRFSPTMIIDTPFQMLTQEQLKLLNRGPCYVPPCQLYVSSTSDLSLENLLDQRYKLLQHSLNNLFAQFNINITRSMFLNKTIKNEYKKYFTMSLPRELHQRASYEHQLVQSIREHLKIYNLILRRTADQRNVFYLGYRNDFEKKVQEYLETRDVFEICQVIDNENLEKTYNYLNQMVTTFNQNIDSNFHIKKNYTNILTKIYANMDHIQLPYLYFLPDVSQKNDHIFVQPVVASIQHSVTWGLASFLYDTIHSSTRIYLESKQIKNGTDFIQQINEYVEKQKGQRLPLTTNFVTINIANFRTMVSHRNILLALQNFFRDCLCTPTMAGISTEKLIHLTSIFLDNNRCYYNDKIYRFTKGAPWAFPLSRLLHHIYLLDWQKKLLKQASMENEFFGRCQDQIIFTWKGTMDEFRNTVKILHKDDDSDINFNININNHARFLEVYIENQNGTLYTCVDHDSKLQSYTLPYVLDNPKAAHSHWFRSSLIRAARYCTSVYDFNRERIYLEVTCLANGYSLDFVEQRIQHFFTHFDAVSLRSVLDQNVYNKLRHRLFNFTSEQRRFFDYKKELKKKNQYTHLTYSSDFGPHGKFNEKLQEILSEYLNPSNEKASEVFKTKIDISTKCQYSLNALLSQQKPNHALLNTKKKNFQ